MDWSTSPWAFITTPSLELCGRILYASACTHCAVGDVAAATVPGDWTSACVSHAVCTALPFPIIGTFNACQKRVGYREMLASEYGIIDNSGRSCIFMCFCTPCALTQELTEIAIRKAAARGAAKDVVNNPIGIGEHLGGR